MKIHRKSNEFPVRQADWLHTANSKKQENREKMTHEKGHSNRHYYITLASWISIGGNFLLGVSKLVAGFYSGSTAVIGDGLDSLSDVLISFITLIASKIMMKPPDKETRMDITGWRHWPRHSCPSSSSRWGCRCSSPRFKSYGL